MKFDDETCAKNLKSMMIGKFQLLQVIKGETKGHFNDEDVIIVNEQFTSPLKKITFPTPVLEEVYKKGNYSINYFHVEIITEDRSIAIEAAIVRIMKSRRKLEHTSLIQEVMAALQMFKPSPQVIKSKIEQLIDREYLERDPEDKSAYRYLA